MQIQINPGNQVHGYQYVAKEIEAQLTKKLHRFEGYITRIEVHVEDDHQKTGENDKRCLLEARLKHHQPVVASDTAPSYKEAINGAIDKLKRALDSTIGRLSNNG
ncbi:HPF/RaiA family ribosome-associated protein [Legionella londiniensis]|uniref:Sigma 54 modulation protein YhbH n=1 Tax=Legionella londiniensis TaxID=45068 RepID=A0A0W0VSK6_9GAMM|nr:HPF/RaiA family ribosome-associated protein [Legionella londiniensis]KTD23220.1 hypothetical protein Llon_0105 [Legionella londiniensis]STX93769.1 ribosomal subunit interface protein [Legionella londiniensis]